MIMNKLKENLFKNYKEMCLMNSKNLLPTGIKNESIKEVIIQLKLISLLINHLMMSCK